jgi:cytidine deaminase
MSVIDKARDLVEASDGGRLPAEAVAELGADSGAGIERLMLDLLPLAAEFSMPVLSGFQVGAVGLGSSGALYLGANFEFPSCPLNQTVHAEQAVVVNAKGGGETGLERLAVSAPPCGYCRQFLYELDSKGDLDIILANTPTKKLADYLPGAFGPGDLNVKGGSLSGPRVSLKYVDGTSPKSQGVEAAMKAAGGSYAPYTSAYGGAAITTSSGGIYAASYIENAAFNPSISPMQAAVIAATFSGNSAEVFAEVSVVQCEDSKVDHAKACCIYRRSWCALFRKNRPKNFVY